MVSGFEPAGGQASAGFFEFLTFTVPGPGLTLGIDVTLDGDIVTVANGAALVTLSFDFRPFHRTTRGFQDDVQIVQEGVEFTRRVSELYSGNIALVDDGDGRFRMAIDMSLFAILAGGVEVDLFNTAGLRFDLPPGVTFTSESGLFLSEVPPGPGPSPVGEPRAWLMLALGVAAVASRRVFWRA